jgi:hypothetical protein
MSWTAVDATGWLGERSLQGVIRYATDPEFRVEADFGELGFAAGLGTDLFAALCDARRQLEPAVYIACNGARRNVYPSAMQRQAAKGRRAYVLTLPRTKERPQVVDIFEPANRAEIATVDEQFAWFERWNSSPLGS